MRHSAMPPRPPHIPISDTPYLPPPEDDVQAVGVADGRPEPRRDGGGGARREEEPEAGVPEAGGQLGDHAREPDHRRRAHGAQVGAPLQGVALDPAVPLELPALSDGRAGRVGRGRTEGASPPNTHHHHTRRADAPLLPLFAGRVGRGRRVEIGHRHPRLRRAPRVHRALRRQQVPALWGLEQRERRPALSPTPLTPLLRPPSPTGTSRAWRRGCPRTTGT